MNLREERLIQGQLITIRHEDNVVWAIAIVLLALVFMFSGLSMVTEKIHHRDEVYFFQIKKSIIINIINYYYYYIILYYYMNSTPEVHTDTVLAAHQRSSAEQTLSSP